MQSKRAAFNQNLILCCILRLQRRTYSVQQTCVTRRNCSFVVVWLKIYFLVIHM